MLSLPNALAIPIDGLDAMQGLHSAHRRDNFFEFIVYVFHEVTLFFTRLDLMPLERFRSPNGLTAAEFPDSSGWPERTPRLVQV